MNTDISKGKFTLKLGSEFSTLDPNQIVWHEILKPEEIKAAEEILKKLDKSVIPNFERASLEPSNIVENPKEPYEMHIPVKSDTKIYTDGNITEGRIINYSKTEQMKQITVSNYNYIITYRHFPAKVKGSPDTKYFAIVTKTAGIRLYVKYKLGLMLA